MHTKSDLNPRSPLYSVLYGKKIKKPTIKIVHIFGPVYLFILEMKSVFLCPCVLVV